MTAAAAIAPRRIRADGPASSAALVAGALLVVALIVWQALISGGTPDPIAPGTRGAAAVVDIAILVFREGLECILVLAAITANRTERGIAYRRPIAAGVVAAMAATLVTWRIAVAALDDLSQRVDALYVQAATGLVAVVVLVVVMNWFFHKVYWTGWIALHTTRKKELLKRAAASATSRSGLVWGLTLLGFSSFYREGFEVVLFLQSYRLKLGGSPVLYGVLLGTLASAIVAVLTFVAHRRLPYKKMLVFTGVLLGVVLLVMVGEQAQEMQLAHWLTTTPLPSLQAIIPSWLGLWFAIFPTAETLGAQALAAALVLGSYGIVRVRMRREVRRSRSA
jgi:high-affinity iron transporter